MIDPGPGVVWVCSALIGPKGKICEIPRMVDPIKIDLLTIIGDADRSASIRWPTDHREGCANGRFISAFIPLS